MSDFYLKSRAKTMREHEIRWGSKILLDLDWADDLSILDENVGKMNELLEVLWVQRERIDLKINVKKTKSLRLGISKGEVVMSGNEKINQLDSFIYLGSIISKNGGCSEDVESRLAKAQSLSFTVEKVLKNRKISLCANIRTLEAIVMTLLVKYSFEA